MKYDKSGRDLYFWDINKILLHLQFYLAIGSRSQVNVWGKQKKELSAPYPIRTCRPKDNNFIETLQNLAVLSHMRWMVIENVTIRQE